MRVIFIIIVLNLLFFSETFAQYKVMVSNGYPPFNYLNEEGELVGFNIDIINAINQLYGNKIEIGSGTWSEINEALKNEKTDAIGGAHYPGYPDTEYLYTRSAINTSHCFFYNENYIDKFSIELLQTLKTPTVALWKNDVLEHYMLTINPSTKFIYLKNYEDLIKMLDNKTTTCIFAQRLGGNFYAKKLGKDYIKTSNHQILEQSMGFKVSKNQPELASMLNNGLEVIMSNGEYHRIYKKWIAPYSQEENVWQKYYPYIISTGGLIVIVILLLAFINYLLQSKVKIKTQNLQQQLQLNSRIMLELERQKIKAVESDKMKSAFLANMSHEIRTPMNGILGFAELLKTENLSLDEQHQFLDIILQSGNRMLNTINNIIDVSKLEAGAEEKQVSMVNIKSIVSELQEFFKPEAGLKGLDLVVNSHMNTTITSFYTDEYKLNSILTNLIKNAIKFTLNGFVKIEYTISDSQVEFIISDSGIGIPKDKQSAIFDQFTQANFSHSSGFEGSGLGLAISKGYVDLLEGQIHLESEPQKGTIFKVTIPNLIAESTEDIITESFHSDLSLPDDKFKFIIAEDDSFSFDFLKHALMEITDNILHANDGQEVVDLIKANEDTDIILMDMKMPKLNGIEATKQIREFNKEVCIIAQTAYAQDGYQDEVMQAGCDAYLVKPLNKHILLKTIFGIIKNRPVRQELISK